MIWFCLALALLVSWLFYRRTVPALSQGRRWLLFALRALTLWVLLLLLLNPVLRRDHSVTLRPEAWLLQDVSLSMSEVSTDGVKSDLFAPALEQASNDLHRAGYEAVLIPFAAGVVQDGDTLALHTTRLTDALEETASRRGADHLQRIVLFSDGWLNDEQPEQALQLGVPIDAWAPAWRDSTFNLRLTRLHAPDEVFAGEEAPLAIDVHAQQYNGPAIVTVRVDGRGAAQRRVDFSNNPHQQIALGVALDKPGLQTIEAVIAAEDPLRPEPDTGDNRQPVALHVRDSHPSAVILCDRPDWDTAALLKSVARIPGWNATVWQSDRGRWRHGARRVSLGSLIEDNTRLLMLVNHAGLRLSPGDAELVERFVNNGGGLLLMGLHVSALGELLPGSPSNVRQWFEGGLMISRQGRKYETFRRVAGQEGDIPPVDYQYITASPGAETLAHAVNPDESPLAVTWRRGEGRVLWMACMGLWRWGLWGEDGDAYTFIADAASWLGHPAAKRFAAFTDRAGYRLGETVRLRLHAFDERMSRQRDLQPLATVLDSTGAEVATGYLTIDEDGAYMLPVRSLPASHYAFTITDERTGQRAEGEFAIAGVGGEHQDRGVNTSLPAWLAQRSGGRLYIDETPVWPSAAPEVFERHSELALYKKWWVIALFLVAFGVELFLRKRWGLL